MNTAYLKKISLTSLYRTTKRYTKTYKSLFMMMRTCSDYKTKEDDIINKSVSQLLAKENDLKI